MQGTHQGKQRHLWSAVAATSLLYAAAHPPWSLAPAALLAVAPAAAALLDPRSPPGWRRAAVSGAFFGIATTWLLVAQWSYLAASDFFPGQVLTPLVFTAALPLVASGIALYYAAAFALIARLAGLGAAAGVLGTAALWTTAEIARGSIGYGNPWASFAAALAPIDAALSGMRTETPVSALLRTGGAPAVAFLASAVGASLGLAWTERRSAVGRGRALAAGAAVAIVLLVVAHVSAWLPLDRSDGDVPREPLRVALVQTGVGGSQPWQGSGASDAFRKHIELTSSPETKSADLIVWPENALPFLLDANPDRKDTLRELARVHRAALLVGGSRSERDPDGATHVYNSAFLFPADGSEPLVYDKRVLMPFVERVPAWAGPLLDSPWRGPFGEGSGPSLFRVKDWDIAPLICLEAIYPGDAAARVAAGADLLVNLSNDSWFDHGAGAEQHFGLAMLRAAETSRPLVRVATTGVSAIVAADGLVSWRLPQRTAAVALVDVLPPRVDSPGVRGGRSGFVLFVVTLAIAAALLPRSARRDPKTGPGDPS